MSILRFPKKAAATTLMLVFLLPLGGVFALTPQEERSQLELELQQLEQQIQQYEQDITKTQQEKKTLQNQITIVKNQIAKLNLQITQSNRLISDLKVQIADTSSSIDKTGRDIEDKKAQLGDILQRIYEEDQKTALEILLTGSDLSEFFENLVALDSLNARNRALLLDIQDLNVYLQDQKVSLETDKQEEENFVKIQILQRQQTQAAKAEQERLLQQTQGKEAEYQKQLANTRLRAQEIRNRIFDIVGVPDAPTFGEALAIAQEVSARTGIRAALLLAVLTQESNLGKNVGQCYMTDAATGGGISIRTGAAIRNVMKPSRDVQPFLRITGELGRDASKTPVSCPIPSVGGYGGAMGPAQFIPSTWALYEKKLKDILGRPGDPWNIKDAFMAAAVLLVDSGAAKQTYTAEWRAAMIYFSGSTNTRYRFYGDSVMAIAKGYEDDIKALAAGAGKDLALQ
ncbi:MAG: lytic murein transglycosylase [Parcubacteria group bacterium]|nr:lytic murein transglycosylase [Parcubacteria group bacterium]